MLTGINYIKIFFGKVIEAVKNAIKICANTVRLFFKMWRLVYGLARLRAGYKRYGGKK